MKRFAIVGGGSWGTALALLLSGKHEDVRLWIHDPRLARRMEETRENDTYLPGFPLPPNISITHSLPECAGEADAVVIAVPSHAVRGVLKELRPALSPGVPVISATKGLEEGSLCRISEVITSVLEPASPQIAVLSGPNFAREIAAGKPAATVAASADPSVASAVQRAFSSSAFRVYTSPDPIGVELGGAIKNVIAIGAGLCEGLGLGHSATAALITRGLAEMTRLAVCMGALPQTLSGLAGAGDLVLTCTGAQSRNRLVGLELARGRPLSEIASSTKMVAEGIKTTHSVVELGRRQGVDLPIVGQMDEVLHLGRSPRDAIRFLMERTLRDE